MHARQGLFELSAHFLGVVPGIGSEGLLMVSQSAISGKLVTKLLGFVMSSQDIVKGRSVTSPHLPLGVL